MTRKLFIVISFFSLMLSLCMSLHANEESLLIYLDTAQQQLPAYIGKVQSVDQSFSDNYLKKIEDVINYDFKHNGITQAIAADSNLGKINYDSIDNSSSLETLKQRNVLIAVVFKVNNKKLSIKAVDLALNKTYTFDDIALTGELAADRVTLHKIHDKLHIALFGFEGIASTHLLFTLTEQNSNVSSSEWPSNVYECDYDGANLKRLTRDSGYCVTPSYFPARKGNLPGSFLYVSYKTGQPKIYIAPLKHPEQAQRLTLLKGNQLMPVAAATRDFIAFISDVTGNPDIFIFPFDVEKGPLDKPRQVFSARQATQASPTISPDGKKMAFVSNKDGSPKIYVIDIAAAGVSLKNIKTKLISHSVREATAPVWSPDGTKIAFSGMVNNIRQIWIYDLNEDNETQLTEGRYHKENPTWAADSQHIAYNTNDTSHSELYFTHIAYGKPIKLAIDIAGTKRFPFFEQR